jgi:hypothetical protein
VGIPRFRRESRILKEHAKRVGLIPGRVWFRPGNAINAKLTAQQRRNFLRFLSRHGLRGFLAFDDFHRGGSALETHAEEEIHWIRSGNGKVIAPVGKANTR